ncbi:GDSL-type esterase/lipase family protein [Flagellimonas marinaquae]
MDSLGRPSNFEDKVAQFKMFPNDTRDVIFLGNSITAGTQWNELLDMDNAVNRGISGDTTFGVLERLDEITEGRPAKIFILLGINDLARNISNDIILRNYSIIIDRIQKESPSTQIYVQTLLPVNRIFKRFVNHYNKASHILKLNKRLQKLTNQKKVNFIDLHPHFLDESGRLDIQYTNDGLHLTATGYRYWALLLKPYL